jgi:hypothetical protein
MNPWVQYVIAFVLLCHGAIYVGVGSMLPAPVKGWKGTSWLLGSDVSQSQLTTLIVWLHVLAGVSMLACALVIGMPWLLPEWWRAFALTGAMLGIMAFVMFWDGQTAFLIEEGALGALISLVVLVTALAFPTAFDQ